LNLSRDVNGIKVPVLLGPTASGKTGLAVRLSMELGFEIVSCDSRQIYRFMDIGTAKPDEEDQRVVKHWMIDVVSPDQTYSCHQFARGAEDIIRSRSKSGKILFICGGSGLYFKVLSEGIGPSVEPNAEFRARYREKVRLLGNESIFEELRGVDPLTASSSSPSNIQRNIRALEVYYCAGIPLSELKKNAKGPAGIEFIAMVTAPRREELYRKIDERVESMARNGLFDEFKALRRQGYDESSPGMRCLGYKELFAVEKGAVPYRGAIETIKLNTRHYAKRQITWFRHQIKNGTLLTGSDDDALKHARDTVKKILQL
jgi:tRNA dimethylallyltransferase